VLTVQWYGPPSASNDADRIVSVDVNVIGASSNTSLWRAGCKVYAHARLLAMARGMQGVHVCSVLEFWRSGSSRLFSLTDPRCRWHSECLLHLRRASRAEEGAAGVEGVETYVAIGCDCQ
jgi:hypothetical protein